MTWATVRVVDTVERALHSLAVPAAFGLAASWRLGCLGHRLTRGRPTAEEIAAIFPLRAGKAPMLPGNALRIARAIAGVAARDRWVVATLSRRGSAALRGAVDADPSLLALSPPGILLGFHIGAWNAFGPALERLGAPLLSLRLDGLYTPPPSLEVVTTRGETQHRAAAFRRALLALRAGHFVGMTADVFDGAVAFTRCLGRSLPLARGAFALARLSGAPLVPITAEGSRARIRVRAHPPLTTGMPPVRTASEWEQELAERAGGWLEGYLRDQPQQTGFGLFCALLNAPPAVPRHG